MRAVPMARRVAKNQSLGEPPPPPLEEPELELEELLEDELLELDEELELLEDDELLEEEELELDDDDPEPDELLMYSSAPMS
jgi:hypothetical protein